MGKTIIINLEKVNISGDVLDVGEKNLGIIYNLTKEAQEEMSLDYVNSESKIQLKNREYDACTFFFELNKVWTSIEKEKIIKEVYKYIKLGGEILIWDINKERGKVINNKIKVILPKSNIKEFNFKNLNVITSSNIEETKKILEKYFNIEETKAWEDIFFLRGKKLETNVKEEEKNENEGVTYSD
ncbi:hypothetical protein [Clostridium butyricum]